MSRVVVPALGHGGGRVRFEPVADTATDARREILCAGAASVFGEPGELSLDDHRGEHAGELCRARMVLFDVAWAGFIQVGLVRAVVLRSRHRVLHVL